MECKVRRPSPQHLATTSSTHSQPLPQGGGCCVGKVHHVAQPPRACLTCNTLTHSGSRCEACNARHQTARTARKHRPHYNAEYRKRAKVVRDTAVTCWICKEPAKPNDPWTADHIMPSDINSPLLPAHRSCNSRRGNSAAPITTQPRNDN